MTITRSRDVDRRQFRDAGQSAGSTNNTATPNTDACRGDADQATASNTTRRRKMGWFGKTVAVTALAIAAVDSYHYVKTTETPKQVPIYDYSRRVTNNYNEREAARRQTRKSVARHYRKIQRKQETAQPQTSQETIRPPQPVPAPQVQQYVQPRQQATVQQVSEPCMNMQTNTMSGGWTNYGTVTTNGPVCGPDREVFVKQAMRENQNGIINSNAMAKAQIEEQLARNAQIRAYNMEIRSQTIRQDVNTGAYVAQVIKSLRH